MDEYTGLSLFSGGGGMDLAFEEEGFKVKAQVEIDAYCNAILEKRWPGKPRFGDIRKLGRRALTGMGIGPTVDVVFGGPPCQPFSNAGKRRGKADNRHLWPEMYRIIRMLSPRFVLFENVPGIVRLVLDDILADLESSGYTAIPFIVPACAVGAPHRRDRVFIMAYAQAGGQTKLAEIIGREQAVVGSGAGTGGGTLGGCLAEGISFDSRIAAGGEADVDDAKRYRCEGRAKTDLGRWQTTTTTDPSGQDGVGQADAIGARLEIGQGIRSHDLEELASAERSGRNDLPDADGQPSEWSAISRAECGSGSVEPGLGRATDGSTRRLDGARWPVPPGKEQEAWEAPRLTTEKSNRTSRLKVLGNAVVWQVVAQFAKAIRLTLEEQDLINGR